MPRMSFDQSVPVPEQWYRVAMAKCVRKHGKRHGTRKDSAAVRARKKKVQKGKIAAQTKVRRKYLTASRAYWLGQADTHPTL